MKPAGVAGTRTMGLLAADERRRGLFFIGIAAGCVGLASTLQLSLNSNFLVGEIGVSGMQVGLLEAVRESQGILALLALALIAGLTEPVIASIVLVVIWLGLGSYSFAPNYAAVMALSVVWSLGLHVWMPLPNSMTLALTEPGRAGSGLGRVTAAGAMGSGIGLAAAFILTLSGVPIRPLYLLAGGAAGVGAAACLGIPRGIKTPGPSFVFRKRYLTYYGLNFLEGWRKQIAYCFAGFLLVNVYHTPLPVMIGLWGAIQGIGFVLSPRVGKLIDRVGERRILTFYYAIVTFFFIGYALLRSKYLLYAVFVMDGATFAFATAITSYVNKIAPPSEHTPTLSMGVAMNHIASVSMPFLGGILWTVLGYQWAFFVGLPAAAASILIVRRMPARSAPLS
jgi:predicted MFS family arabinose efflux permease